MSVLQEELAKIEKLQTEQMQAYAKELQAWLDERGVSLNVTTIIRNGQIINQIDVMPSSKKQNGG